MEDRVALKPGDGDCSGLVSWSAIKPPAHALIWFQDTAHGRAALEHARMLASGPEARLTVVTVATYERVTVGCASCRHSAVLWNNEMAEIGHQELQAAARRIGSSPGVHYVLAVGSPESAIAEEAVARGCDVIVLPWRRFRRLFGQRLRTFEDRLSDRGAWRVVIAPPAGANATDKAARGTDT